MARQVRSSSWTPLCMPASPLIFFHLATRPVGLTVSVARRACGAAGAVFLVDPLVRGGLPGCGGSSLPPATRRRPHGLLRGRQRQRRPRGPAQGQQWRLCGPVWRWRRQHWSSFGFLGTALVPAILIPRTAAFPWTHAATQNMPRGEASLGEKDQKMGKKLAP